MSFQQAIRSIWPAMFRTAWKRSLRRAYSILLARHEPIISRSTKRFATERCSRRSDSAEARYLLKLGRIRKLCSNDSFLRFRMANVRSWDIGLSGVADARFRMRSRRTPARRGRPRAHRERPLGNGLPDKSG